MDYSFVERQVAELLSSIGSINVSTDNSDVVSKLTSILSSLSTLNSSVVAKSPVLKASTATLSEILTANIPANTPVKLFNANPNRIGFTICNNSTNSLYVGPTNSPAGARLFFQLASNAGPTCAIQCFGPTVWTGDLWVIRNAGTGGVTGYELTP